MMELDKEPADLRVRSLPLRNSLKGGAGRC